jgi:membrane fusion protein (multidrug efflux system)
VKSLAEGQTGRRAVRALLLLMLTIALGCKGENADAEAAANAADSTEAEGSSLALPVVGQEVRRGDLVLSVITTGQVRAEQTAMIKSETQGTINEILVRAGDRVRAGQALVKVDPRPLDLDVQEAEARLAAANLRLLDNTVPDSIVTGKALTGDRLRNAEVRAGLEEAKVALARAKFRRDKATVIAPFDGVMDEIKVTMGDRLTEGQDIGRVVNLDLLRIDAAVLEHDLPLVRVGGVAVATASAMPDRPVHGTIAAVLPTVDSATRAGRALIRARGNGILRPGMYADVRLEASRLRDRTVVPARAVIERDGRPLVFVVKGGRAQWTYILPGRTNGLETEVLPDSSTGQIPLQPGDVVLVEGHLTLTHDAPVRVVKRQEREN